MEGGGGRKEEAMVSHSGRKEGVWNLEAVNGQ